MAKKTFAVIGMGRFGLSVVEELIKLDADVLVIDRSNSKIDKVSKIATHAVSLDSTDKSALEEVGISSIDHVIVAIGQDVESSILTTLILKDLGVERVTVKVLSQYHAKVVEKLGADELIWPEQSTGKRLAKRIISKNILEYYDLSETHSFIVVQTTKKVVGSSIINIDIRNKYGINIVAIRRGDEIIIPTPDDILMEKDELLLAGSNNQLEKFTSWIRK